ncbi:UNVERIFIED_CONTAM: hypothetical protein Slati_2224000 [Sesamum latifolium]|uniref:Endonuclease/exonuclease/phosphatase domain-containing protein n=1 Tax=Sesamum latifolium TaxID=2727402 RepID=A0AAW2WUC2_9LAMI
MCLMIRAGSWKSGLNGSDHQRAVADLIAEFNLTFLGLLEMRVRQIHAPNVQVAISNRFTWLHTRCLIYVIYGSCDIVERRALWDTIIQLSSSCASHPWLVLGDFNVVLDRSEVSGAAVFQEDASGEFHQCLMQVGLTTLPLKGASLSWHNIRDGEASIWKRLDRVVANDVWFERWPSQYYLSTTPRTSDHSPVILCSADQRLHSRGMFRFDNWMTLTPHFSN